MMGTANVMGNSTSPASRTALDDTALVHACKRGDAVAFEELVRRYDRRLLSVAQHVTHNRDDAEDAVQEAFVKVSQVESIPGEFEILDLADSHHDQ
jgi:hypothetical protein